MIPVELKMENFLSWKDATVDFASFDHATIVGPNGVGKSSLLDALTFALFGRGRGVGAGGKDLDRLIRTGESQTRVTLSFTVADKMYRVTRERGKTQKVRFSIIEDGEATHIGDGTVRDVDTKIEEVLGLDYDAFTASAFLEQGAADRFMEMSPTDRKRVFRQLLNLGVYDRLHDKCRETIRHIGFQLEEFDTQLESGRDIPERIEQLRTRLTEVATELETIGGRVEKAKNRRDKALEREHSLKGAEKTIADAETSIEQANLGIRHCTADLNDTLKQIAEYREYIADAEAIRRRHAEWESLTGELKLAREGAAKAGELRTRALALTANADGQKATSLERIDGLKKQLAAAEKQMAELDPGDLTTLETSVARIPEVEQRVITLEAARNDLLEQHAGLNAQVSSLTAASGTAEQRIEEISTLGGTCDKCGSELTDEHRASHLAEAKAELERILDELKTLAKQRDETKQTGRKTSEQLEAAKKELDTLADSRRSLDLAKDRIRQAEGIRATATELTKELTLESERLPKVGEDLRAEAASLMEKAEALPGPAQITELETRIQALSSAPTMLSSLETAERDMGKQEERANRLAETLKTHESAIQTAGERIAVAQKELEGAEAIRAELKSAEAEHSTVYATQLTLTREEGEATAELKSLEAREAELAGVRSQIAVLREERRLYEILRSAFSDKGGIPDQIIKDALVDLEAITNEIVAKIAPDFTVNFPMHKEMKTGGLKDTLDVVVRADWDQRPFENLSGGEQFRIAIAVRLALSRLLVQRARAQLGTLVIDEGFGSQDPEGRSHLVAAINAERGRFAKILLITHIDELKDTFPVQLVVGKDQAAGSNLQVRGV